jgi:hypothetical protein
LSRFGHKVPSKALPGLILGVFLIAGPLASAAPTMPPDGAKSFAEELFRQLVDEMVFADRPEDWGFREEKGTIAFSGLYPVYSLNADFARGKSDELITGMPPTWVAIIFQDGQPVNAIGALRTQDGRFVPQAIGYPPELPHGLLNLRDGEIVIHLPPADEFYVYSETAGILTKMGVANGTYTPDNPMTVEEFRRMLMERYKLADDRRKLFGLEYAIFSVAVMAVIFAGARVYFDRRSKAFR